MNSCAISNAGFQDPRHRISQSQKMQTIDVRPRGLSRVLRTLAMLAAIGCLSCCISENVLAAQLLGRAQAQAQAQAQSCDCSGCNGECSSSSIGIETNRMGSNCAACDQACPQCHEDGCVLEVSQVEDEKTCYKTEQKAVCIPKVRWPWQEDCPPQVSESRTVTVLKKHKFKCTRCAYTWKEADPNIANKTTNRPAEILQNNRQPSENFGFARQSDGTFEVFGAQEPYFATTLGDQQDSNLQGNLTYSQYGAPQASENNYPHHSAPSDSDSTLPTPYRILDGHEPTFPPSAYPQGVISGHESANWGNTSNTPIDSYQSFHNPISVDPISGSTTTFSDSTRFSGPSDSYLIDPQNEANNGPLTQGIPEQQPQIEEATELKRHSPLPAPPVDSHFPGAAMSLSDDATSGSPSKTPSESPVSKSLLVADHAGEPSSQTGHPVADSQSYLLSDSIDETLETDESESETNMTFSDETMEPANSSVAVPDYLIPHSSIPLSTQEISPTLSPANPLAVFDASIVTATDSQSTNSEVEPKTLDQGSFLIGSGEIISNETEIEELDSAGLNSEFIVEEPGQGEQQLQSTPPERDVLTEAPEAMEIEEDTNAAPSNFESQPNLLQPIRNHSILAPIETDQGNLSGAFLIRSDFSDQPKPLAQRTANQPGLHQREIQNSAAENASHVRAIDTPIVASFSHGSSNVPANQDAFLIRTVNYESSPRVGHQPPATARFSDQSTAHNQLKIESLKDAAPTQLRIGDQNRVHHTRERQDGWPKTGWIPLSDK